jgi:hypothetical protein
MMAAMHVDEAGVWHANVTLFGAWSAALGYTMDWLLGAPPNYRAKRRRVEWEKLWYELIDLDVPSSERRALPIALHVASITGALCSDEIARHLFVCADLVIFQADTLRAGLDRALCARAQLEPWIVERADDALVVFQFDTGGDVSVDFVDANGVRIVENPAVRLGPEDMCAALTVGTHPFVETNARLGENINLLFRAAIDRLLRHRERLVARQSYA